MVLTEMAPTDMESDPSMQHAMRVCETGTMRFKLGAVIVDKRGKILGKATNSKKTHPRFGSGDYKCIHAEGGAIYKAVIIGHDVEDSTLYVYRQNGNMARPCSGCQDLLEKFKIKRVYYSNNVN